MAEKSKIKKRFRSDKLFFLVLSVLIVVDLGLALRFFNNRLNSAKDQIITTGSRIQSVFQNELKLREHFIKVLSYASEFALEDKITLNEPIQEYLRLYSSENDYVLDLLPGYETSEMGTLTGTGNVPAENSSVFKEIYMAISLTPIFRALIEEDPETPWVYYTSYSGFIYIYPPVSPLDFFFSEELYSKDFVAGALPENNPERRIFWSPVYIDEAGKGLMTTLSAPVYAGDTFTGSVSIDLHVNKMNWLLNSYKTEFTTNHLVNSRGEDILDGYNPILSINPKEVQSESIYTVGRYWITIADLGTEDWYIMLQTDRSRVIFNSFMHILPAIIIMLLVSGTIILVYLIIRAYYLLRSSEVKFRTFVENANDIIYSLSVDGVFLYVSPNWKDIIGHDTDEVIGKSFELFVHPDDVQNCRNFLDTVISTGNRKAAVEYRVKYKDGSYKWHASTGSLMNDRFGTNISFLGIARDITQRKLHEEELERLVEQKEFLMKELTHRVKNNMMVVSSLVSMKNDTTDAVDLSDLVNQINAMRFIYEKLSQGESFSQINIHDYICDLVSTIFAAHTEAVRTEFNIELDSLSSKTAIPLGLIINEIATNTLKHGLTDASAVVIFSVDLKKSADGDYYELVLSNTGKPIPEELNIGNSGSLGLRLIFSLVKQLEGTVEIKRAPHPVFFIRFPAE